MKEQWTDEEVRHGFETIAGQYFERNFGRMGKADLDVLMFSLYLEHLWKNDQPDDDYSIAVALGIPESRVKNLKIKKQLQYPAPHYEWKKAFAERIRYARYDDKKALVKVSIPDPNVRRDIEHYIDEKNWYSEYQLNSKLLQMRADQFIELCVSLSEESAEETGGRIDTKEDIEKRLKECQASDWVSEDEIGLIQKIREQGLKNCLPDIGKGGSKAILKIGLNAIPMSDILKEPLKDFLDKLF